MVYVGVATAADQVPEQRGDQIPADNGGIFANLKQKLQATEFEFSRAETDVPFVPLSAINAAAYGKTEFQKVDGSGTAAEYRSTYLGAYTTVPLYIGKRGLAVAVPYVSHTRFTSMTEGMRDQSVESVYLPIGGAWQAEDGNQWGGFIMPSVHSPISDEGEWADDFMGGVLGRHFSGNDATWYYGAVYDYSFGANYIYPYLGYMVQLDPKWLFSLVMPWPAVSYAPSDHFVTTFGVLPSGANWVIDEAGENVTGSFGGWDVGVRFGWRLTDLLWLSAGGGFSGLRSLQVDDSGEMAFEQNLSPEPFVSIGLGIRPN